MKRKNMLFLLLLATLLLIGFGVHLFVLYYTNNLSFINQLTLSYVVNFLLAAIVLIVIEKTLDSHSAQAGFVFMAGSGLKFLIFFLIFYPLYKADGKIETIEFTTFFVPYAICLIAEVTYLSKQLNNQ